MSTPSKLFQSCLHFLILMISLYSLPSLWSCPQYQKAALLEFKDLVLGRNHSKPSWPAFASWNSSSTDCCKWVGVTCDPYNTDPSQVTGLQLSYLYYYSWPSDHVVTPYILTPLFRLHTLTSLDISGNGIQGEIPGAGFANLTSLEFLDMAFNEFRGSLPPELFCLRQLAHLYLEGNLIDGRLSSSVGNLSSLKYLFLTKNSMINEIPEEIGNLTHLEMLSFSGNKFSGKIPFPLSNLKELRVLFLSDNHLEGHIPRMANMTKLEQLWLEHNFLTGEIPTWLFDLEKLTLLNLGGNRFTWENTDIVPKCKLSSLILRSCNLAGDIPSWLSNQTKLSQLDLSDNHLSGIFPEWLAKMKSLGVIDFSDNKLGGPLPPQLFQSKCLLYLSLSRNNFSGELPDTLGQATRIKVLLLSGNDFSGPIPKSITNTELKLLDLSNNKFCSRGEIPIFDQTSSLVYIDISNNRFSCEIPTTFPPSTEVLLMSQNEFFGSLPQGLTDMRRLEYLDLHDNNITGGIPSFLSQLSLLQIFNLRNNDLAGSIPPDLSHLVTLRILDLSSNHLSGEIPLSVGYLRGMTKAPPLFSWLETSAFASAESEFPHLLGLEVFWKKLERGLPSQNLQMYTLLDLSNNQLSGEIPSSLGELIKLKSLNLSNNNLTGMIPKCIGDLGSLESLDLSNNALSGQIPQTFAKLGELSILVLSNNKLEGEIPRGPQMDTLNDPNDYANNNGLCGIQIQVPCHEAFPQQQGKEEAWFSWEMALIGYAAGFVAAILAVYTTGYFDLSRYDPRQDHHWRRPKAATPSFLESQKLVGSVNKQQTCIC